MHLVNRLVPGVLAGALLLGSAAGTFAAKPHKASTHVSFAGQVSNPSSTGFTLTRSNAKTGATRTVQVTVSATTKERALKGTTGTLSAGEYALAVGTRSGKGTIAANRVVYSTKPFRTARFLRHRVAGTVNLSQSSATSLSITTKKGKTLNFQISATTKFRVNGQVSATVPAFTNGEKVVVRFERNKTTKALDALTVIVPKTA